MRAARIGGIRSVIWLGGLLIAAAAITRAAPPKLVIALMVDQLRYDVLERMRDRFTTNGFRLLMDHGAYMTSAKYDYCPTVTGPGHASVLSGGTPSVHGIVGNDWFDRRKNREVNCVEDTSVQPVGATNSAPRSPQNFTGSTVADQMRLRFGSKVIGLSLKDRSAILPAGKKPTGAYWIDTKTGRFITSTYYLPELPPWVQAFNDKERPRDFIGAKWDRLQPESSYQFEDLAPGEATLTGEIKPVFPHIIHASTNGFDVLGPTPFADQLLAEFARAAVEAENLGGGPQPDLLCLSFSALDLCGHSFGPHSHEVQDLVLRLDRELAAFFEWLDRRIGLDNIVIVLSADHGIAPLPEFAQAQGLNGRRWNDSEFMLFLMDQLDKQFGPGKYFQSPKLHYGHIYLNHATLLEKGASPEAVALFLREAALGTGLFQAAYTREQLLDGRAPGWIGAMVLNGYHPVLGGDLVLVGKPYAIPGTSKTGTTHGSLYGYDTRVPVLFYGKPFRPGRYPDAFSTSDIAATLSAALRIEEPAISNGRPFVKALTGE